MTMVVIGLMDEVYQGYLKGLPQVPDYYEWASTVPKLTRVYSVDGKVIAQFYKEKRTLLDPEHIPKHLKLAVLAAEDSGFFNHGPISPVSLLRAFFIDLFSARIRQGGSSITQQTVKVLFLSQERTLHRKFRELVLAFLMERRMTKQQILSVYMSSVYLGFGNIGFAEAARFYLRKDVQDISIAEAALLAGMVASPTGNNPVIRPEASERRRLTILKRMLKAGFITKKQYDSATDQSIKVYSKPSPTLGLAPYFAAEVRKKLVALVGRKKAYSGGLRVYTTLDSRLQGAVNWITALGLARLYKKGRRRSMDESKAGKRRLGNGTVVRCNREMGQWLVRMDDGRRVAVPFVWGQRLFLPGQDPCIVHGRVTVKGIRKEGDALLGVPVFGPQAAVVVVDPTDFGIQALTGGDVFAASRFNRAFFASRPVGSVVKPFIYAVALDEGKVKPDERFPNTPLVLRGGHGRLWRPSNYEGFDGKDYTLEQALAHSVNTIAIRVLMRVGVERVAEFFHRMGMAARVPRNLSLALGSMETSPLEIAVAMGMFAMDGRYDRPFLVRRITDWQGRVLFSHKVRLKRVMGRRAARQVRGFMRAVARYGTGRALRSLPGAWGKTGTTNRSREAWFAGGCGGRTAAVYVGYDDRLPMPRATGANTALPMFKAVCEWMIDHQDK
jgi:penicillin-binding protein 1A